MMAALPLAVGIGAGLATALLLAAVLTATSIALPLFLVSPLPVAIAALGWGWIAGIAATVTVGGAVFAVAQTEIAAAAFLLVAAPAAWVGYLLTLSWPMADGTRYWFPLGHALVHGAATVALALILVGLIIGYNPEAMAAQTAAMLQAWVTSPEAGLSLTPADIDAIARLNMALLPYTTSALALLMLVFSLWLGARIVALSGRLNRPLTPLWTAELPAWAVAVFAGALAASLLPPPIGPTAAAIAGAFGLAAALVGLAVLHALTRGLPARPAIIAVIYVVLVMLRPAIAVFALLGLAESLFRFRARARTTP